MIIFPECSESLGIFLLVVIPPETEVLVLHDPGPGPHHVVLQDEGQSPHLLHLGTTVFLLYIVHLYQVNNLSLSSIITYFTTVFGIVTTFYMPLITY